MSNLIISIPESLENLQLPNPELVSFYRALEDRIIWIEGDIGAPELEIGKYILEWNKEDRGLETEARKPIKLLIMSCGGDLSINNTLIDLIEASSTPIYGVNMGQAFSAGCFIFMACHKRFALRRSTFLLHKGSGEFSGNATEVFIQISEYQRQIDELVDFVRDHSTISTETLVERLESEWYITAGEALNYGFVDKIIKNLDEIV